MGKGLEQTLLQGRHIEGPETYEKMLSITSHQRDANQNHNEVSSHTSENGQHKQIHKQMLERMRRKGNPSHCWWECRLVRPLWKTVWNFLRKLKMELLLSQQFHCWDYTLRTLKHQSKRTCAPQCSSQHNLQ